MMIFDIETDGLDPSKIHCMSWTTDGKSVSTTHDYKLMSQILLRQKGLIGHNIVRYDVPVLERILGIKIKARLFDTLPMSWVINHTRSRHGLEGYGVDYGIPKPKITDWSNLTPQDYAHRCQEDVAINYKLWKDLLRKFMFLYNNDKEELNRFFMYLSFKMDCAKEAELQGWKLDKDKASDTLNKLLKLREEKETELTNVMPMRKLMQVKTKPKTMTKKDGSLSAHGKKWLKLLDDNDLPQSYEGEVTVVKGTNEANPNSSDQVKDWLFSLGWEPCYYQYKDDRQIPQVRKDGELTPSVEVLIDKEPKVKVLEGLTVLTHRIGILKGFLETERDGYVRAEIDGFTNTLRFRHKKPLVNLPGVDKPYGKEIRGCLIAPDGHILCGADMTSLEDTTKRHYMHPYDPDYVADMSRPGFDPHLDLAKHAGYASESDIDKYNKGEMPELKSLRKNFKVVNYSATYGVGSAKLSRTTGMAQSDAQALLDAYWDRNWSVKQFAEDQKVRSIGGDMWVQNPVSKFWHSLRFEKDAFSTINQSTGAYCFDKWVAYYRSVRSNIVGQFHDESINVIKKGEEDVHTKYLQLAIDKLNKDLKLNVTLGIDIQYGNNYSEIH